MSQVPFCFGISLCWPDGPISLYPDWQLLCYLVKSLSICAAFLAEPRSEGLKLKEHKQVQMLI